MPTNTAINSSLVFSGQVPPDLECRIGTLSEIAAGVVAVTSIQSSSPDGSVNPPDDSVAQQALSTANAALALAQSVQASLKDTRTLPPQSIPTGDSTASFAWTVPMPSTDYAITFTWYAGSVSHPGAYYGARVLESSITENGFSVVIDNAPANSKLSFFAIQR